MKTQSRDTNIQTEVALIALLRRATPAKKFAQVRSLSQTTLSLSRRAIMQRNLHLHENELKQLFIRYQYGEELADQFMRYLETRGK